jgi:hypothetical protein
MLTVSHACIAWGMAMAWQLMLLLTGCDFVQTQFNSIQMRSTPTPTPTPFPSTERSAPEAGVRNSMRGPYTSRTLSSLLAIRAVPATFDPKYITHVDITLPNLTIYPLPDHPVVHRRTQCSSLSIIAVALPAMMTGSSLRTTSFRSILSRSECSVPRNASRTQDFRLAC